MTKVEFENLGTEPILSLNKKIGSVETSSLLKLITIDTEGEILEVQEIYNNDKPFWVKYENVDLMFAKKSGLENLYEKS